MSRTRSQRVFRGVQKSIERYHDKIVERILGNPAELGENAPAPKAIVYKTKYPYLPELPAQKKKGSLVDLLFLYQFPSYYEILVIEVKIGQRRAREGIYQINKAKNYFKNQAEKWFANPEIREKLDPGNFEVWLSTLLLVEKILAPIKEWVVEKRRFRLGEITSSQFVQR